MAKEASNSPGDQIEMSENDQPSNLHEFRVRKKIFFNFQHKTFIPFSKEMVDLALNLDVSCHTNNDSKSSLFI